MSALDRVFRGRGLGQERPLAAIIAGLWRNGEQGLEYDVPGFRDAWNSAGLIEQDFADLLANPDALAAVATQAGLAPAPLVAIVAAADITDEPADAAMSRLGLKLVTTP